MVEKDQVRFTRLQAEKRSKAFKLRSTVIEKKVQQGIADGSIFLPGYSRHGEIGRNNPRFIEDNDFSEEEE